MTLYVTAVASRGRRVECLCIVSSPEGRCHDNHSYMHGTPPRRVRISQHTHCRDNHSSTYMHHLAAHAFGRRLDVKGKASLALPLARLRTPEALAETASATHRPASIRHYDNIRPASDHTRRVVEEAYRSGSAARRVFKRDHHALRPPAIRPAAYGWGATRATNGRTTFRAVPFP